MFRIVDLPDEAKGKLFLHSMPGRYEVLDLSLNEITDREVSRVVSLAPMDEIYTKSPAYAEFLTRGRRDWYFEHFPIPDYSFPDNGIAFGVFVRRIVQDLLSGNNILAHCGAGIGRTGIFTIAVLLHLGLTLSAATALVERCGSKPETSQQKDFLAWYAMHVL